MTSTTPSPAAPFNTEPGSSSGNGSSSCNSDKDGGVPCLSSASSAHHVVQQQHDDTSSSAACGSARKPCWEPPQSQPSWDVQHQQQQQQQQQHDVQGVHDVMGCSSRSGGWRQARAAVRPAVYNLAWAAAHRLVAALPGPGPTSSVCHSAARLRLMRLVAALPDLTLPLLRVTWRAVHAPWRGHPASTRAAALAAVYTPHQAAALLVAAARAGYVGAHAGVSGLGLPDIVLLQRWVVRQSSRALREPGTLDAAAALAAGEALGGTAWACAKFARAGRAHRRALACNPTVSALLNDFFASRHSHAGVSEYGLRLDRCRGHDTICSLTSPPSLL